MAGGNRSANSVPNLTLLKRKLGAAELSKVAAKLQINLGLFGTAARSVGLDKFVFTVGTGANIPNGIEYRNYRSI